MYVCVGMHLWTYVCIGVRVLYACVYVCMSMCMCVGIHVHICVSMRVHVRKCICVSVHVWPCVCWGNHLYGHCTLVFFILFRSYCSFCVNKCCLTICLLRWRDSYLRAWRKCGWVLLALWWFTSHFIRDVTGPAYMFSDAN